MPHKSKYPGVYWHPQLGRWVVQLVVFVGAYDDEDEAGAVRGRLDRAAGEVGRFVRRIAFGGDGVTR